MLIQLQRGQIITIEGIVGQTALKHLQPISQHEYSVTKPLWAKDDQMLRPGVFQNLYQALPVRENARVTEVVDKWNRLEGALRYAGIESIYIPGGELPLHYSDETALRDGSKGEGFFFISSKQKAGKCLDAFPADAKTLQYRQKRAARFQESQSSPEARLQYVVRRLIAEHKRGLRRAYPGTVAPICTLTVNLYAGKQPLRRFSFTVTDPRSWPEALNIQIFAKGSLSAAELAQVTKIIFASVDAAGDPLITVEYKTRFDTANIRWPTVK